MNNTVQDGNLPKISELLGSKITSKRIARDFEGERGGVGLTRTEGSGKHRGEAAALNYRRESAGQNFGSNFWGSKIVRVKRCWGK